MQPLAREFILFCSRRRGAAWPALYDEMCWVASQRLFRGLGYAELKSLGLSLGLTNLDETINMIVSVTGPAAPSLPVI